MGKRFITVYDKIINELKLNESEKNTDL